MATRPSLVRAPSRAPRRALALVALATLAPTLHAQPSPAPRPAGSTDAATMMRRTQLVVPPLGWRIGAMAEQTGAGTTGDDATPGFPAEQSLTRTQLRVGFPTYRRGLFRTVVTNEVAIDQYAMDYGAASRDLTIPAGGGTAIPFGAPAARRYLSLQHELLVSQALGDRWRVSGIMFSAVHTTDLGRLRGDALQLQGGAFLSRTFRPTLQLGAGVLAINVYPYVIPTVRYLHVGRKWRADILIPRGEAFYEVTPAFEVGAQFRFFGNRWDMNDENPALRGRTTMTFTHVGPAFNWRPVPKVVLTGDAGLLLRRFHVDAATPFIPGSSLAGALGPSTRVGTFDPSPSGYARLRATWFP